MASFYTLYTCVCLCMGTESYLRIDLDDHEGLHQDFLQRLNSLHQSQHYLPELDYGPLQIWVSPLFTLETHFGNRICLSNYP